MSLRNNLLVAAILTASLGGVSSIANAADTAPIVRETCARATLVDLRQAGHPGKSIALPERTNIKAAQCLAAKRKPLILASHTDARGGLALVRGRADRALAQIRARRSGGMSAAESTNLCVAYTVLRQWSDAGDACDAAVASALDMRRATGNRRSANEDVGAAYSNRAVMHWLSGDEVAAHNDLSKARKFSPYASYVTRNLRVAERGPSLAHGSASASSGG